MQMAMLDDACSRELADRVGDGAASPSCGRRGPAAYTCRPAAAEAGPLMRRGCGCAYAAGGVR